MNEDVIPDAAFIALANALDNERLEQLELPNEIVTTPAREALTARLGNRVRFK